MILNTWALYKVIEIERGIAIINIVDRSNDPQALELVVAELPVCMEYLVRYCHERAVVGHTQALAHAIAIKGLNVFRAWMQVQT